MRNSILVFAAVFGLSASVGLGQADSAKGPYKLVKTEKVGGDGSFDYVTADPDTRHLFVVRGGQAGRISCYDLDTLKLTGEIPDVSGGHGVAVDPKTGHAFSSSQPVVMFDAKTLAVIKTIPVKGRPDGILFEPSTKRVYILSQQLAERDRDQHGRREHCGHDRSRRRARTSRARRQRAGLYLPRRRREGRRG